MDTHLLREWFPLWAGIKPPDSLSQAEPAAEWSTVIGSLPSWLVSPLTSVAAATTSDGRGSASTSPTGTNSGSSDSTGNAALVRSLERSGLVQAAGVLTTTLDTGQQWDAPNAWPPLVLLTIEGLQQVGTPEAQALAVSRNHAPTLRLHSIIRVCIPWCPLVSFSNYIHYLCFF